MSRLKDFLLKNQTFRQTVMKNTFWLFVGQVLGRVLRAVIVIYAARLLGAADWGVFSYAISVSSLLTIFTDLGINAILTKETARLDPEEAVVARRRIVSTSFFIKLVMISVSLFILLAVAPLFSNIKEAVALFPIMGLVLIFENLREFGFAITRALEKMEIEAWLYILTNLLIVGASFVFLTVNPSPMYLAYGYAFGTGAGMLMTLITLKDHFRRLWQNFSKKMVRPILASAWPFAMLGIMGGVMINTDSVLLGIFRSAEELGYYAAAQKPVLTLYILPTLLATSLFPALSRLTHDQQNQEKVAEIIRNAITFLISAALPIVLIGMFLAPELIRFVYGAAYLPAVASWQILLTTLLVIFPGMILGNAIFAYDQQRLFTKVLVIGAASNVLLDLLFIPRWGGPGSAVATLIAQLLTNGFLWMQLRRINPRIANPKLTLIAAGGVIMVLALIAGKWLILPFFITAAAAGLLYLTFLFIVKEPILTMLWRKS